MRPGHAFFSMFALIFIVMVFQNCGSGYGAAESATSLPLEPFGPAPAGPVADRARELELKRARAWRPSHPYWEIVYDGSDSPGDNVAGPFMWDNPIDDDWFDPLLLGQSVFLDQFRLNTPSRGFLTVDRTYMASGKTGSVFRRDEYLDPEFIRAVYGITLEVRLRLLPNSQAEAFFINYVGRDCTCSVSLSGATALSAVGSIASGSIYGGHSGHRALDTTSEFVTLRLVRGPNAPVFSLYVVAYASPDDIKPAAFQKVLDGACDPNFKVGSAPGVNFPYVQIGDNSNDPTKNAAFILDFIRYRRDAISPADPLQSLQSRNPPRLPGPAPATEESLFVGGYFADLPVSSAEAKGLMGSNVIAGGPPSSFKATSMPGVVRLVTASDGHADIEIGKPVGLVDQGGFTIEARLQTLADHGPRGFRLSLLDQLGSVSLYISKDMVELGMGTKPSGFQTHPMNTMDQFHIFRLVRKPGELYAHLYVDNDPVPVIVDQHLSAETESRGFAANPILSFGGFRVYPEPFIFPVKTTSADILIDYIRWHGSAYAP